MTCVADSDSARHLQQHVVDLSLSQAPAEYFFCTPMELSTAQKEKSVGAVGLSTGKYLLRSRKEDQLTQSTIGTRIKKVDGYREVKVQIL